jgi:Amt family ammonium transporter
MELTTADLKLAIDTVWTLLAGCLVFWMGTGFAMLEAGLARAKHTTNVLAMNYAVLAVSALVFWGIGFGLLFAEGNEYMGMGGFFSSFNNETIFSSLSWSGIPLSAKFFFQLAFADATASIVSGIVAERMKFSAYMLFCILLVGILYPIAGHWAWGGGFLSTMAVPFQDFAGSTIVHSIGGWCCLTGTIILGPRIGKFVNGKARSFSAHNLSLATLGTLILWMGWFGFNAGSTMAGDAKAISHIMTTTMLAGAAGMTSAMFLSFMLRKHGDLGVMLNGTLAGLVAITAGCNAVSMVGAVCIGLLSGLLCYAAGPVFDKLKLDDPVGALSVHLVNGVFGTIAVGLFATKANSVGTYDGLFYGGGFDLLWSQLVGVACVGLFILLGSTVCWWAVKMVLGSLRVPEHVELEGLDMHQHGALAYVHADETAITN